jgi:hypothetical protein
MPRRIEHEIEGGVEVKRCGICHEYKALDQFHRVNNTWDGLFYACKGCWQKLRISNTRRRAVGKYNSLCRRVLCDERYIKRGTKVKVSRDDFIEWYNAHYIRGGHVDRIDNNGHYSFDNMQMITQLQHNLKRRKDRLSAIGMTELQGERYCFDCGTLKHEGDFYPKKSTKKNIVTFHECCKECSKEKRRIYYAKRNSEQEVNK